MGPLRKIYHWHVSRVSPGRPISLARMHNRAQHDLYEMKALLFVVGLAVAACGGSDESGLFGASQSGGVGASGGVAGGSGSGGAAASVGATAGAGGVPSGGNAGAPSGGAAGDAGGPTGGSGGIPPEDAGSGGNVAQPGVGPCGAQFCSFAAGAQCCVSSSKGLYCSNDKLGNPCSCTGFGCDTMRIDCDGKEDCDGAKQCCAVRGIIGPGYDRVECRDSCTGIALNAAQLCHPGGPACPSGQVCKPDSGLPPDYFSCQTN